MGLNISGLVIDKNYENKLIEIESIIRKKLAFEKEVSFEQAIESWKEDTYCDIYFSKNGTLILLSMEMGGFEFYIKNQTAFSFILSEMTMVFTINYTKNNQLLRYIMVSEQWNEDEGKPLEFEKNESDKSKLIYHLIEKTLGQSFDDIDLEAKCFRYSFNQKQQIKPINLERKPWWKFW